MTGILPEHADTVTPFCIDGPAVISFSGGRTSGYMLRRILDAGLRPDVHVLFADTGKERAETYAFIATCAREWAVPIVTVQRPGQFTQLITDRHFLPNPIMRFCTQALKLAPMRAYMVGRGYDHWTNVVGIRADEPRRVAKMRANTHDEKQWDNDMPLAAAGVTLDDVTRFWQQQPFDLQLRPSEGNCDLCFLKGTRHIRNIIRDRPDLAAWWIEQEERIGGTFRKDRPTYRQLLDAPKQLDLLADADTDELIDCYCHD